MLSPAPEKAKRVLSSWLETEPGMCWEAHLGDPKSDHGPRPIAVMANTWYFRLHCYEAGEPQQLPKLCGTVSGALQARAPRLGHGFFNLCTAGAAAQGSTIRACCRADIGGSHQNGSLLLYKKFFQALHAGYGPEFLALGA